MTSRYIILALLCLIPAQQIAAQTKPLSGQVGQKSGSKTQPTSDHSTEPKKPAVRKKAPGKPTEPAKSKKSIPGRAAPGAVTNATSVPTQKPNENEETTRFSIAINLGYESVFGNGMTAGFWPNRDFTIGIGAGYSYSGLRGGIFSLLSLEIIDDLDVLAGGALGVSAGRKDKISFDAKFTPEGSSTEEPITATRRFELSSAQLLSILSGMRWRFSENTSVSLMANYNFVIGGNDIHFTDEIEFSDAIIPSNLESFNVEFDRRANDLLLAGGAGAFINLEFIF
jgi:hypothetical protein